MRLFILFWCMLYCISCNGEQLQSKTLEKKNVVSEIPMVKIGGLTWKSLDGEKMRLHNWDSALNACANGWHLPDVMEWDLLWKYSADSIKFENGFSIDLNGREFWTSSYNLHKVNGQSPNVYTTINRKFVLRSGTESRMYSVLCVADYTFEKKEFLDSSSFWGVVGKKEIPCLNGAVYVRYYDDSLFVCKGKKLEQKGKLLYFLSDSLDLVPDTVFFSLKSLGPCSFGMNGTTVMTGHNFYMYQCYDKKWHGLGFFKMSSVQSGLFVDSMVGSSYKTLVMDSIEWMAENLEKELSSSICYENKSDNCSKYGRLYDSNLNGLCPKGWRIPQRKDWIALYSNFGLNGAYIRSKEDWFLDFQENKDVGFSAYPAGYYDDGFVGFSMGTGWWSYDDENRLYAVLFNGEKFDHSYSLKNKRYYVRCIRNVVK